MGCVKNNALAFRFFSPTVRLEQTSIGYCSASNQSSRNKKGRTNEFLALTVLCERLLRPCLLSLAHDERLWPAPSSGKSEAHCTSEFYHIPLTAYRLQQHLLAESKSQTRARARKQVTTSRCCFLARDSRSRKWSTGPGAMTLTRSTSLGRGWGSAAA